MKKIKRSLILMCGVLAALSVLWSGRAMAQDSLFPGLTTYLVDLYKSPFRLVGEVTEVAGPRRFVLRTRFDNQMFVIYKERFGGFFKDTARKAFGRGAEGEDQVSGVRWEGNRIVETWSSRRLSKDILDFTFMKNPDRLVVLCRDDDGYALEAIY